MELPSELKPDLHKALLGPLSLAEEIYGALLPGCIFLLLLVFKGNTTASKAFAYPFLGYKTKIVCGLLTGYFIGKVAAGLATFCEETLRPKNSTSDSALLKAMPDEFLAFLGGLGAASMLGGKSPLLEWYTGFRAQFFFYLSSGLILLAAACIPGDGNFRFAEGAAGIVFITTAVRAARRQGMLVAGIARIQAVPDSNFLVMPREIDRWLGPKFRFRRRAPAEPSGSHPQTAPD